MLIIDKIKEYLLRNTANDIKQENKSKMNTAINTWLKMYKGQATWVNIADGIYSAGIEQTLVRSMRNKILAESTIEITGDSERAQQLKNSIDGMLLNLNNNLEKALVTGGFILKPYPKANDEIGIEFVLQGNFIPFAFDDNGNLIDVGFLTQIKKGKRNYSKIERHTLKSDGYYIQNSAYCDDREVPLTDVEEWAEIKEKDKLDSTINLYGYYRVPLTNTVDLNSPLGISFYEPAKQLIELADKQMSRLDWEYNGGQMAVDVDEQALDYPVERGYFNHKVELDECQKRLYRGLDLGDDKLYEVFAPALRDQNFMNGLNNYYKAIEDKVGVSRGTLSDVSEQPKTATEIVSSKQREYLTVSEHQKALERCLLQLFDALVVYSNFSGNKGDCKLTIDWGDSVLVDRQAELQEKIMLMQNGILRPEEVRGYYLNQKPEEAVKGLPETDLMGDLFGDDDNDGEAAGADNE